MARSSKKQASVTISPEIRECLDRYLRRKINFIGWLEDHEKYPESEVLDDPIAFHESPFIEMLGSIIEPVPPDPETWKPSKKQGRDNPLRNPKTLPEPLRAAFLNDLMVIPRDRDNDNNRLTTIREGIKKLPQMRKTTSELRKVVETARIKKRRPRIWDPETANPYVREAILLRKKRGEKITGPEISNDTRIPEPTVRRTESFKALGPDRPRKVVHNTSMANDRATDRKSPAKRKTRAKRPDDA